MFGMRQIERLVASKINSLFSNCIRSFYFQLFKFIFCKSSSNLLLLFLLFFLLYYTYFLSYTSCPSYAFPFLLMLFFLHFICFYFLTLYKFIGEIITNETHVKLFNPLMLFWLILDQMKTCLVVFLWKRRTSSVFFWSQYYF